MRNKVDCPTPFVYGFLRPQIHIPQGLTADELRYVTLHEQTHIRRRDHLVKLFAFALLCVHWFNPFAWLAFMLMCADMEMSCDERVLRELGGEIKDDYSLSLVRMAAGRRILSGSPLAFGEGGMKERVKNVLNFKKRPQVIVVAAIALVAVLSVGFAVNRANVDSNSIYNFDDFLVNGSYRLNHALPDDVVAKLTPSDRFNDDYQYNFEEFRYSADGDGRVTRFHLAVYETGIFDMWVRYDRERYKNVDGVNISGNGIAYVGETFTVIEQIEELLGKGKTSWYDRDQRLRYERYTALPENGGGSVAFVYADNGTESEHRLVWVIAESGSSKPIAETPAPPYDPNFVFENKFEVMPNPDKYTPAMSSVPGILLGYKGQASGKAAMTYECESGGFLYLEDGIITNLGSKTETAFGDLRLHWTPDPDTKDGDAIVMRLVDESGGVMAVQGLTVRVDENYYYTLELASVDVLPSSPEADISEHHKYVVDQIIASASFSSNETGQNLSLVIPAYEKVPYPTSVTVTAELNKHPYSETDDFRFTLEELTHSNPAIRPDDPNAIRYAIFDTAKADLSALKVDVLFSDGVTIAAPIPATKAEADMIETSDSVRTFSEILGLNGYIEGVESPPEFVTWRYFAEVNGNTQCVAEVFGFATSAPEAYSKDIDGNGVKELIGNCQYGGDGARRVIVYRNNNGIVEIGTLAYDTNVLPDLDNWGSNAIQEEYDAENDVFAITYSTKSGTMARAILTDARIIDFEPFIPMVDD
jgi:hypothetical protein